MNTILLVCALICFVLKAFNVSVGRNDRPVDLMNLGFAFIVASMLV